MTCGSTGWWKYLPFRSTREFLFANVTDEVIAANRGWLDHRYIEPETGRFILSHHSYVVRTPRWTAIVDTCCGNQRTPGAPFWHRLNQPYIENMAALGVQPEDDRFRHVHASACRSCRLEHAARVDGRWVPTFPKARYLMGRTEYDHWDRQHRQNPERAVNRRSFVDSVLPVVAAGQAEFVDSDHCVFDDREASFRFVPAPGHTIGNMMIDLRGGHDHAVVSGDVIHHPIQCAAPGCRTRLTMTRPWHWPPASNCSKGSPIRRAFF